WSWAWWWAWSWAGSWWQPRSGWPSSAPPRAVPRDRPS
ncbi:MAG: hypothetical protein AVDCRST_MAG20-2304, partial [uncultured Acidimicrobiales bacterium]